jgi:hypothetical protein
MRNIYTSTALGSYRKVSQIGHKKNIIWSSSSENQNAMSMSSVLWDDQSKQVGDSSDQLGFRYDVHKD